MRLGWDEWVERSGIFADGREEVLSSVINSLKLFTDSDHGNEWFVLVDYLVENYLIEVEAAVSMGKPFPPLTKDWRFFPNLRGHVPSRDEVKCKYNRLITLLTSIYDDRQKVVVENTVITLIMLIYFIDVVLYLFRGIPDTMPMRYSLDYMTYIPLHVVMEYIVNHHPKILSYFGKRDKYIDKLMSLCPPVLAYVLDQLRVFRNILVHQGEEGIIGGDRPPSSWGGRIHPTHWMGVNLATYWVYRQAVLDCLDWMNGSRGCSNWNSNLILFVYNNHSKERYIEDGRIVHYAISQEINNSYINAIYMPAFAIGGCGDRGCTVYNLSDIEENVKNTKRYCSDVVYNYYISMLNDSIIQNIKNIACNHFDSGYQYHKLWISWEFSLGEFPFSLQERIVLRQSG